MDELGNREPEFCCGERGFSEMETRRIDSVLGVCPVHYYVFQEPFTHKPAFPNCSTRVDFRPKEAVLRSDDKRQSLQEQ